MKVSIIGAGNVGASVCYLLIAKEISKNVILVDINRSIAQGKAIDLQQASVALVSSTRIQTSSDYKDIENSDIVVITAGIPRRENMSREDLLGTNIKIINEIVSNIKKFAPNAIIITVSNPLDIMNYAVLKLSNFERRKVIGMGGILDSARMAHAILKRLDDKSEFVNACVIGAHGEQMLPLLSHSFVGKKSVNELFDKRTCEDIINDTKSGGARIVKFLQTSAYYAPAAAICILIEAILKNKKEMLTCSVYLEGEYGIDGVSIGVPAIIGKDGVEEIIELSLNENELKMLHTAAIELKEQIKIADKLLKENV
ncbi:MAG: malate dehydrogenase [Campylobacteraceae bacterium]|jgi:malate dehydrogenase|nr:malate dehydrogenase [Campylobacteraceae bacterium]